ncbi:hypothetical protein SAMN05216436_12116 [bacterium A37T11]|nr:hypothetical protein SAMN05216436_12116 [bacterium A37T11]
MIVLVLSMRSRGFMVVTTLPVSSRREKSISVDHRTSRQRNGAVFIREEQVQSGGSIMFQTLCPITLQEITATVLLSISELRMTRMITDIAITSNNAPPLSFPAFPMRPSYLSVFQIHHGKQPVHHEKMPVGINIPSTTPQKTHLGFSRTHIGLRGMGKGTRHTPIKSP